MHPHLDHVEFAENPDPRCPCVLLLDVSSSMQGDAIKALNEGLKAFQREVSGDLIAARRVEIAIVTFGSSANVVQDFVTVDQLLPPELNAGGQTFLGAGIDTALNLLEQRKAAYRNSGVAYYRPWVFLITDGAPVGEADAVVESSRTRLVAEQESGKLVFFAVGTESADFQRLGTFTTATRPPLQLRGVQFVQLFEWLSKSQQAVAQSRPGEQVPLPPAGWASV
jgi:uncharacterized protein YegL